MLWMLLVYVVGSNGYAGQPVLTPSFHGATFPTKEECASAAKTVELYKSFRRSPTNLAKVGLVLVCAPVSPAPRGAGSPGPLPSRPSRRTFFPPYSPATPPRRKSE